MVAEIFCEKKSEVQNLVIHTDHNKLNNRSTNLKWSTQSESTAHQQNSPKVIAQKKSRFGKRANNPKGFKLNETRVMLLKKKIVRGVPTSTLAKQFKVSQMQILRIKNGKNWADVKASNYN